MHRDLDSRTVLRWWSFEPVVGVALAIGVVLYAVGLARLWRTAGVGKGIRTWEGACFGLGMASLVVALFSPLDALSDILFSAHMTQHEILILIAAPLVVLGRPLVPFIWALPREWREPVAAWAQTGAVAAVWTFLTGPLTSMLIHAVTLWIWHLPRFFEGAMRHEGVHAFQHLTFFLTAGFFWWALVHGRYGRLGYGVGVLYVFATALHSSLLGAFFTFTDRAWYPIYGPRAAQWNVDPVEDQRLAGLIMWIPAGAVFILIGIALFAAWLGESERRVVLSERERLAEGSGE